MKIQPDSSDGVNRRAVLRVTHDVDGAGQVVSLQLEPLPDVTELDVVWAAWQAARRCHPWIIGPKQLEHAQAAKEIAISQINHLMNAANEALLVSGIEHEAFRQLRDAVIDLRGYMPAICGDAPAGDEEQQIRRSA